jgi:hypothetical protein
MVTRQLLDRFYSLFRRNIGLQSVDTACRHGFQLGQLVLIADAIHTEGSSLNFPLLPQRNSLSPYLPCQVPFTIGKDAQFGLLRCLELDSFVLASLLGMLLTFWRCARRDEVRI